MSLSLPPDIDDLDRNLARSSSASATSSHVALRPDMVLLWEEVGLRGGEPTSEGHCAIALPSCEDRAEEDILCLSN